MDPNSKEKTLDKLTKAQKVKVVVSEKAGFDGLASGLALYLSLVKLGKSVSIQAKQPTVDDAAKLYAVDKIGKFQNDKNLVINVENAVDTVDKVTYFLDNDRLKIVIHPFAQTNGVSPDQISFENAQSKSDLLFAIGFNSQDELNNEIVHEQIISTDSWIVGISLGELNQKFAHTTISNPQTTSLSELTAILLRDLALPLNEDISYNLYAGIANSTDKFDVSRITPSTFEIASWLLKFGAGKASFAQKPQAASRTQAPPIVQQFSTDQNNYQQPFQGSSTQKDWLKPPKIYKGSKAFDTEH